MKIRIFFFSLVAIVFSLFTAINGYSSGQEKAQDHLTLAFYNTDNPVRFIVVEKSTQKLKVFEQQQSLSLLKTYDCATGENPGKKIISGDSRTPVGLYFITESYEDKKITVFGSRAFHLDYPNVFDRFAGHLGDGIYMHGTNKTLIPYSTNGCITLANQDLDELADYLIVNTIPIIVVETLTDPLLGKDLKMDKNDSRFTEILHELSPAPPDISTDNIESLSLLTLNSQTVATISYKTYDGNSLQYSYHKRVYLAPAVSKTWRTLYSVESQDTVPTVLAMHPVKSQLAERALAQVVEPIIVAEPLIGPTAGTIVEPSVEPVVGPIAEPAVEPMVAQTVEQATPSHPVAIKEDIGSELLDFVKKWQTAWSNKDIDTYMQCYSPSFKDGRLDRNGWRAKKSYLNKKYKFIRVAIRNIVIEWTDAGANVSFYQEYESDKYQTSGNKLLQLINRDNRWMIQKEIM